MSGYVITIDTGTTNTRAVLWDKQLRTAGVEKNPVGVRNTAIDGHNGRLKLAVRGCLERLVREAAITFDDVHAVLASGMITSDIGLLEVPHIKAPAGVRELAAAAVSATLPEVCPLPVWFIPGVKNDIVPVTIENFEAMDFMRGEEVETIAVIDRLFDGHAMLIVLPGSHTKLVSVDRQGKITGSLTTMSGELLASITNDTILADAVGRKYVSEKSYDRKMILTGYETAQRVGLCRACFSGRILSRFVNGDTDMAANFVLGAVLQSDVAALRNSSSLKVEPDTKVIVAGKSVLRLALTDILRQTGFFRDVSGYEPEAAAPLSSLGALLVARERGIL